MPTQFSLGDIVQLKSGGPAMTVSNVNVKPDVIQYTCQWFKGASKEHGYFDEHTLKTFIAPST